MGWGRRYEEEQDIARHVLLASSGAASAALSTFVNWLLLASGASFTLLVSNIEEIVRHIGARSLRWALIWVALSLLLGMLSRLIGTLVTGTIANAMYLDERAKRLGPIAGFNQLAFMKLVSDGFLSFSRCVIWRSYASIKAGDTIPSVRGVTYTTQIQGLLTLGQLILLSLSVVVLAHGVQG